MRFDFSLNTAVSYYPDMYLRSEGYILESFGTSLKKIVFMPKFCKISFGTWSSVSGPVVAFHSHTAAGQLQVVVYYAVCGSAQGLMVTQITEAPHSARCAKQLFTVVLPLSPLK